MGLGQFFKRLVKRAPETLEGTFEETLEELFQLWHERDSLPLHNQGLLRVEFVERGQYFPADRPASGRAWTMLDDAEASSEPDEESDEESDEEAIDSSFLKILCDGQVLVNVPGGVIAIIAPTWHANPDFTKLQSAHEQTPILHTLSVPGPLNECVQRHVLPASIGVTDNTWSEPSESTESLDILGVTAHWKSTDRSVYLVLENTEADWRLLVGAQIPLAALIEAEATHLIGGLDFPESDEEAEALQARFEETEPTVREGFVTADWMGVDPVITQAGLMGAGSSAHLIAKTIPPNTAAIPYILGAKSGNIPPWSAEKAEAVGNAIGYLIFERSFEQARLLVQSLGESADEFGPVAFAQGELGRLQTPANAQEASRHYLKALEADPPYARAACNLMAIHPDQTETLEWSQRAIELLERHPIAVFNRAIALWRQGLQDDAMAFVQDIQLEVTAWTRSLLEVTVDEHDPTDDESPPYRLCAYYAGVAFTLGHWVLNGTADPEARCRAVGWLQRSLELDGSFGEASVVVSDTLWASDLTDEALKCLDQAIACQPYSIPLRFVRGERYQELKRWEEAIADYNLCLKWSPESAEIRINLALAYGEAGQLDAMNRCIDTLLEENAEDARVIKALEKVHRIRSEPSASP